MNKLTKQVTLFAVLYLLWVPAHSGDDAQVSAQAALATLAPAEVPSFDASDFTTVGTAQMKWFWIKIYQAILSTPTGTYQPNQWPILLDLRYQQNITAQQLIESTVDDWQRQNIDYQEQWLSTLEQIWPDISAQDQLILYVDEASISHFFYNKKFIGSIADPLFSPAFTAIWLSDNTIKPAQRNQLIGINP